MKEQDGRMGFTMKGKKIINLTGANSPQKIIMKRKRRLMFLRKLRNVRDFVLNTNDAALIKEKLMTLEFVSGITIEHGWTTWVTVELNDGTEFIERKFWTSESLQKIMKEIYANYTTPHQ